VDQLGILTRIPDSACLEVRIVGPNEVRVIDLSSALVGMFVFLCFIQKKLRCEIVIGIVLCYSHRMCYLLYYLYENGIHVYQFTYELLLFCFFLTQNQVANYFRNRSMTSEYVHDMDRP